MKVGTFELLVILLVAFLVLGPDQTLAYARKVGKGLRTLRIYMDSFTEDIRENVTEPLNELAQPLTELTKPIDDISKAVREPLNELDLSLRQTEAKLNSPSTPKQAKLPDPVEELEEAIPVENFNTEKGD